jgi:hypothetical protein
MGYILFGVVAVIVFIFITNLKKGKANAQAAKEKALSEYMSCKNILKKWHRDNSSVITNEALACRNLIRDSEKRIVFNQLYTVKTSNEALQFVYAKEIFNLFLIDKDISIGDYEFIESLMAFEEKLGNQNV